MSCSISGEALIISANGWFFKVNENKGKLFIVQIYKAKDKRHGFIFSLWIDISREDKSDMLRVLVATDCHLGYMEKDEIRRHDSFQAFEEICSIAEQKQVQDPVLLLVNLLNMQSTISFCTLVKITVWYSLSYPSLLKFEF